MEQNLVSTGEIVAIAKRVSRQLQRKCTLLHVPGQPAGTLTCSWKNFVIALGNDYPNNTPARKRKPWRNRLVLNPEAEIYRPGHMSLLMRRVGKALHETGLRHLVVHEPVSDFIPNMRAPHDMVVFAMSVTDDEIEQMKSDQYMAFFRPALTSSPSQPKLCA